MPFFYGWVIVVVGIVVTCVGFGAMMSLTVFLQPLFPGGLDDVPPGSSCIANAYTNNHDALADPNIGTLKWAYLHVVDTVGLVHAMILRLQAMLLPVQTLVLTGH